MDFKIGLIIQFSGIFLIASLFIFLSHSLKSAAVKYWRNAWIALSGALICLLIAFNYESISKPFFVLYYLGEYAFAFLVIAGCRSYAADKKITARSCWLLVPAILAAVLLSFPIGDFNEVFNFHSLAMSAFFAVAFFALKPANNFRSGEIGLRVMKTLFTLRSKRRFPNGFWRRREIFRCRSQLFVRLKSGLSARASRRESASADRDFCVGIQA